MQVFSSKKLGPHLDGPKSNHLSRTRMEVVRRNIFVASIFTLKFRENLLQFLFLQSTRTKWEVNQGQYSENDAYSSYGKIGEVDLGSEFPLYRLRVEIDDEIRWNMNRASASEWIRIRQGWETSKHSKHRIHVSKYLQKLQSINTTIPPALVSKHSFASKNCQLPQMPRVPSHVAK